MYRLLLFCFRILNGISRVNCNLFECHDDPAFEASEGLLTDIQFNWLGALQYIHVRDGTPHYFRVPRVCLIARQFAVCTAKDAAHVPDGYALGNVVFSDYERDENECKVTIQQLAEGAECNPAVLMMPIADVLVHPEYKHFGVKTSIALLKLLTPVKSRYVLPVCLPFKNFRITTSEEGQGKLIYVDFVSEVPRDFIEEEKEVLFLTRLPDGRCKEYDDGTNATKLPMDRFICTGGCDLQSGAPVVIHEHTGHWNLLALSEGKSTCPDPLRGINTGLPSRHLVIQPYVSWISNAISGKSGGGFVSKDDPFGYQARRAYPLQKRAFGWLGHWWVAGMRCYDRGDGANNTRRFYHEIFEIRPAPKPARLIYYLEIHANHQLYVVCVKVGMPQQFENPMIWGINTIRVRVRIPLVTFMDFYRIVVSAWCNDGSNLVEFGDEGEEEPLDSMEYSDTESYYDYIYIDEDTRGYYKKVKVSGRNKPPKESDPAKDESKSYLYNLTPPDAGQENMWLRRGGL